MKVAWFASSSVALLLSCRPAFATTVFALYTSSAIYIGSDSKIVAVNGPDRWYACKIHIANNFVWASAGLLAETRGPFDLRRIARGALDGATSFDAAAKRLKRDADSEYEAFRERAIEDGVSPAQAHTDLLIAGVDRIAHVALMSFGRHSFAYTECPSAKCSEFGLVELGEHRRLDRLLAEQIHTIWKKMGVRGAIRYLIAAQERATPKLVGGPISILEIDKSGLHWIDRGACNLPQPP